MPKQTTITIETDSLILLHVRSAGSAWCGDCANQVQTLHAADLPQLASLNLPLDETPAGEPSLHRIRAPDGAVRICLNSLLARIQITTRGFTPSRIPRKEDL